MSNRLITLLQIAELAGISQSKMANELGKNQSSVSRVFGGIPALSAEYISRICEMLQINENFLHEKSDYPFLPGSFVKFKIGGLKARRQPFTWFELLANVSQSLKVLLLLSEKKGNVVVACVKDDKGSIFLVSVEIPLPLRSVFAYAQKYSTKKIILKAEFFFDPRVLGPYRSVDDFIASYDKNAVDTLIEDSLLDVLTPQEKKLIRIVRRKKIPIEKIIELITKMKA